MMHDIQAVRQRFAHDFQRPRYHFLPPSNWMNDPNGLIHWQGAYHLFYQHNPASAVWGNMHWGHAVSPDLLHWTDLPLALAPTPGGPDERGVFSGCAVDNGLPTLIYTGVRGEQYEIQTQCLATSRDGLLTWEKHASNPVLSAVPAVSGQTADFRDPFVWREADGWYMVVGSRIADVGGAVFLYRSPDLLAWEYLGPLFIGDKNVNGVIWECPNFFKLGAHWVLIISAHTGTTTGDVIYFVGSYQDYRFTPFFQAKLSAAQMYAPLTTVDAQQRRLLIGWIREGRDDQAMLDAGWSGVQSIPRVLTLDAQQRLVMTPIAALDSLHGQHWHYENLPLAASRSLEAYGTAFDLAADFSVEPQGEAGFSLLVAPDGHERVDIIYNAAQQQLNVHTIRAQRLVETRQTPHALAAGEALSLRILLDASVIEIMANGRTSLTSRVYASSAACAGLRLLGRQAHLRALDLWEMPSIWQ
ncbi:MAG: glycoside hydrolase family 32 protein [Chloroflexi bacterium]|nr:glycoside hydrolase family 32 protein [Chloroflexota bacterium]